MQPPARCRPTPPPALLLWRPNIERNHTFAARNCRSQRTVIPHPQILVKPNNRSLAHESFFIPPGTGDCSRQFLAPSTARQTSEFYWNCLLYFSLSPHGQREKILSFWSHSPRRFCVAVTKAATGGTRLTRAAFFLIYRSERPLLRLLRFAVFNLFLNEPHTKS